MELLMIRLGCPVSSWSSEVRGQILNVFGKPTVVSHLQSKTPFRMHNGSGEDSSWPLGPSPSRFQLFVEGPAYDRQKGCLRRPNRDAKEKQYGLPKHAQDKQTDMGCGMADIDHFQTLGLALRAC